MQNYKLSVTKGWKRYTMVLKAETEVLARERVHKEWYSILSVEEYNDQQELGNTFIFTAHTKDGELKHWKIVWEDIFKIYVKLRKNLEYNVSELFSENDNDLSVEHKAKIISDLNEEYNLLFTWKKKKKIDEVREQRNKEKSEHKKMENFYLKKELEETYKLIDFVLQKIQNLLSGKEKINISQEEREKIQNIYNSIVSLKKSTNLSKLREIWEVAMLKIWKIELREVEEKHDEETRKLLKETNVLLKKLGSKESFIEKSRDISYIIKSNIQKVQDYFKSFKEEKKKKEVDTHSHSYIKNVLFLKRYQEKLKQNNIYILKNALSLLFNKEKRYDAFIRRRVIKQNITIFKAKQEWVGFSYTTVKKWIWKLINYILQGLKKLREHIFVVVFLYTSLFIAFLNTNYYINFWNLYYKWLFYFIAVYCVYLILYFTRNIFLIVINFVFLFFIIIFWVVNF